MVAIVVMVVMVVMDAEMAVDMDYIKPFCVYFVFLFNFWDKN